MRVKITTLYGLATLEDGGRHNRRKFGVPPGGAFDKESFALANALLGNLIDAPAIEFSLGTLEFQVLKPGPVAIVGAASYIEVDGQKSECGARLPLNKGAVVQVGPPKHGLRTYIAFPGGVKSQKILGSVSGVTVDPGQHIESEREADRIGYRKLAQNPQSLTNRKLRVITLEDHAWINEEFEVSREINRVGLRLKGNRIVIDPSGTSEPSVFGAVQVTEDGTLIIHGPDGPTIGGYRKLGGVIRADLDRLGQLMPGDKLRFERVSLEDAQNLWKEDEYRRKNALKKISLLTKGT